MMLVPASRFSTLLIMFPKLSLEKIYEHSKTSPVASAQLSVVMPSKIMTTSGRSIITLLGKHVALVCSSRLGPSWESLRSKQGKGLNIYLRKMDMLNNDLLLKTEATSRDKGIKGNIGDHEMEAAFHFIAFMPIGHKLWKLDGLERQPMCLGKTDIPQFCLALD